MQIPNKVWFFQLNKKTNKFEIERREIVISNFNLSCATGEDPYEQIHIHIFLR